MTGRRAAVTIVAVVLVATLAACGSAGHKPGTVPAAGTTGVTAGTVAVPTAAVISTWPTAWCDAKPGDTRQMLEALMGPQTGEGGSPGSSLWQADGYDFLAGYDVTGHATVLEVNTYYTSPARQATIHCPFYRTPGHSS